MLRRNATVTTDLGEFSDCLITKEWTPLAPGEVEHKHYCINDGLVLIKELKGKTIAVELINNEDFPAGLPGDNSAEFPADALGCDED